MGSVLRSWGDMSSHAKSLLQGSTMLILQTMLILCSSIKRSDAAELAVRLIESFDGKVLTPFLMLHK